jgi:hypothetical protein
MRHEQFSAGSKHTGHLIQIGFDFVGRQMGHHRCHDDEIETLVSERQDGELSPLTAPLGL